MQYRMPGEVLQGERPGLFGLSLMQLFGAMIGYFIGSFLLGSHPIVLAVCALAGVFLTRRSKGTYLAQDLAGRLLWVVTIALYPTIYGKAASERQLLLNPAELYVHEDLGHGEETYILRTPDGQTMSVSVRS